MSTDKFHIHDMGQGNDVHSNVLNRLGYGNLLNRPGRQETTIDTASMYKKADFGPGAGIGTIAGTLAGGIGGADIAGAMGGSATSKLLGALVGAGAGGLGGYLGGSLLDKGDNNKISIADANLRGLNAVGGGLIGGLAGYGTSKYILGSKNKTHQLISALIGAGAGTGIGYTVAGSREYKKYLEEGKKKALRNGYKGVEADRFARFYANKMEANKNGDRGFFGHLTEWDTNRDWFSNFFTQAEENAEDSAKNRMKGESDIEFNWSRASLPLLVSGRLAHRGISKIRNTEGHQIRQATKSLNDLTSDKFIKGMDANSVNSTYMRKAKELNDLLGKHKYSADPGAVKQVLDNVDRIIDVTSDPSQKAAYIAMRDKLKYLRHFNRVFSASKSRRYAASFYKILRALVF